MDTTHALETAIQTGPLIFTGGMGVGTGIFCVKYLFDWLGARVDKREAAVELARASLDAATSVMVANLQQQIDSLTTRMTQAEHELQECRAAHAQSQEELARWRGASMGMGDAKQQAQLVISKTVLETREKEE